MAKLIQILLIILILQFQAVAQKKDTLFRGRKVNYVTYYENGKIKAVGNYDKKNKKTGIWVYFYKNGDYYQYGKYIKMGNEKANGTHGIENQPLEKYNDILQKIII